MSEAKELALKAFFHDPIHKPLVLAARKRHEDVAKELAQVLDIELTEEDFRFTKGMDVLASATERMVLPSGADRDERYQVLDFGDILFRHPLSGKIYKLNLFPKDYEKAETSLYEVLRDISHRIKSLSDTEKLEFLWQNLLDELKRRAPDIPWELLPADTRVPDHTIWSHLKLSTVSKAYIEKGSLYPAASLFIFTVGPVQSFIKVARKAQDFWAGSFMLSFLTFKAIEKVVSKYSSTAVIYPDLQAHPWIKKESAEELTRPTIPNRFVALIPEIDTEVLRRIGEDCSLAVKDQLLQWADLALGMLGLKEDAGVRKVVERQLETAFSSYWIFLPLPRGRDGKKDYERALEILKDYMSEEEVEKAQKIIDFVKNTETLYEPNVGSIFGFIYALSEKMLAARKTLRKNLFGFPEPSNPVKADKNSRVERCHLCGERNAIIRRRNKTLTYYDEGEFRWKDIEGKNIGYRFLPEGEALCSVCLIKRFLPEIVCHKIKKFPKSFSFPSVSDVAVADFEEETLRRFPALLEEFESLIEKIHYGSSVSHQVTPVPRVAAVKKSLVEGQWLFEASLEKEVAERVLGVRVEKAVLEKAKEVLKTLVDKLGRRPCPYYAFIAVDGDQMGKWLSGKKGFSLDDETNIYHPKVWENLPDDFKRSLKEVFEKNENGWTRPVTPAYHASIAKALQSYALKIVPQIVEKQNLGQLVYVGGDDILAFVNLRDLWKVLRLLRLAYSGMVKFSPDGLIEADKSNTSGIVNGPDGYLITMGPNASLSAGIVIAHYKTPLSVVISEGFNMEKRAKNELGRDAFSISWIKHSGEISLSGAKWRIEKKPDTLELAEEVFSYFDKPEEEKSRAFVLSRGLLKEVQALYHRVGGENELFRPLIERAINRHTRFVERLSDREKKDKLAEIKGKILSLIEAIGDVSFAVNLVEMGLIHRRLKGLEEKQNE